MGVARGWDWLQASVVVLSLALGGGLLLVRAGVGTIARDRLVGRALVGSAVLVLAIAPLSWSAWTTLHAPGGTLPIGGPPSAQSGPDGAGIGGAGANFGVSLAQSRQALITFVLQHQDDARFALATASAQQAAPIIIATGLPVMALGGFSGNDQTLTIRQFQARIAAGDIRYVLVGGASRNSVIRWAQTTCAPIVSGPVAGLIVDCQSRSSSSSTEPRASIEPRVIGSRTSWTAPIPARA